MDDKPSVTSRRGAAIVSPSPRAETSARLALFRQQAVDFQRHQAQWGRVALLQPPSLKLTVWAFCVAVAVLIVFLLLAPYARKETVSGYLMPAAGTARVRPPQAGIISAIHVREGQSVEAEQPLFNVATGQVAADGEDVNVAILAALALQKDTLSGQIAAEERRMASERQRLEALIRGLGDEVAQIAAQMEAQARRIGLAEELVAAAGKLRPGGHITDVESGRRESALLEQKQNLAALGQLLAARRNQITEHRFGLEQLPIVVADRVRVLSGELSAVTQRIAEVKGRRAYVIRAPVAGTVSGLHATVGQPVDSRQLLMTIVPPGSALQAELFVPTRAIGFVRPGQRVRILYDAFPYQNFGTYGGQVARVSQTMLSAGDAAVPVELREPVYRVTATLDRPDVDAYGQRVPLQPDMLLRADIILDRRPLMDWILNPLWSAGKRGTEG